jgi:hypothetical protein
LNRIKEGYMDWFFSIIRVAGVSFPVASSLVQLQAEIDTTSLKERIAKLEDPVSYLHDDVPELSRKIYQMLKQYDSECLNFDDDFYGQFSRALAVLESRGYINGNHVVGKRFAGGIDIIDPSYVMYMCALEEDDSRMISLIQTVENCNIGQRLDGKCIQKMTDLPLTVIRAVFDIYESKGYGYRSRIKGVCEYTGSA